MGGSRWSRGAMRRVEHHHAEDALWLFFTVPEVAQILRTTEKGVYAQAERGLLPGVTRIGRRLLFCRAELLDWLRQKSAPSPKGNGR
jgi:excisionase family DNA binding protein